MLKKVQQFIDSHNLLSKDRKYIVALSGGADSVALFRILLELGYNIDVAHCNFHLRGEESDRDEVFCRNLCMLHGIPERLHIKHFDTAEYAKAEKVSIEMAARNLRYEWFEELRRELNADGICVAHHKEDSVETILLNLIRGTGIDGLTGIKAKTDGVIKHSTIIRPLLCVSREEIDNYLQDIGQDHITDSSNLDKSIARNKIRLEIVPLLKEINPNAVNNILNTAQNLRDAANDSQENKLFHQLKQYGFNGKQIRDIAKNNTTGKEFLSPTHTVLINRGEIIVQENSNKHKTEIYSSVVPAENFIINKDRHYACIDADRIQMPLKTRLVKRGDWFVPFGMKGKKLISDFLTDLKMPLTEKRMQEVVTDSSGNIIWVVNLRPDNRFRITDSTEQVLILSTKNNAVE